MNKGKNLHMQAINAREKKQDFLKALKLTDHALIAYSEANDSAGISGIMGTRQNIFGHLHQKTRNKNYLILAKHAAMAAVEIAEANHTSLALPYRDLAKAYEELKDYEEAAKYLLKALEQELPEEHNRPAVKADLKAHLAYNQYKFKNKAGLDLMNEAIAELENAEEDKYNKDVWLSGAHMRAAEMLREDNIDLAREHLLKAKEIIDTNEELVLRKKEWRELSEIIG